MGVQPPTLTLNLFDDVALTAVIEQTARTASGYSLSGRIAGTEPGSVTLVVNGDVLAGTVRTLSATYTIRATAGGMYSIRQIDPSAFPSESEPLVPPSDPPRSDRVRPISPPRAEPPRLGDDPRTAHEMDDGSQVHVLVFYTPAARRAEGGVAAMRALIDLMEAETNQAYAASGVIQRIRLVGTAEVSYLEHASAKDDLAHLRVKSDGEMDEVHALRDQYAADFVHLIVDRDAGGDWDVCGRAFRMRSFDTVSSFEEFAFGLTDYRCGGDTFAHELGHGMGLKHDRYAEREALDDPSATPYGYGYVNQRAFVAGAPASSRWRTIMAIFEQCDDAGFASCGKLLRFSNPQQTFNGDPLGVPGSAPSLSITGPSDARRRLNDARMIFSNFRVGLCVSAEPFAAVHLQAQNGQYIVAERNGGGAVSANRSSAGAWETFHITGGSGDCVRSGDAVSIHTSDGFYFRAEGGGGSTLDATATGAGPWETFVIRRAGGDGTIRSGDFVALQTPTGHYVVAELGGGSLVNANRTGIGSWETFVVSVH